MKRLNKIFNIFIATVWLINGLYCKVLNGVSRHRQIVSRILFQEYEKLLTVTIGLLEILMFIWILSKYKSRINAIIQLAIIAIMNVLEFFLVPDLLLWGKFNSIFAILFMSLIYTNEFILNNKKGNVN